MDDSDLALFLDANPDAELLKNTKEAVFVKRRESGQIVAIIGGTCGDGIFRHVDVPASNDLNVHPATLAAATRSLRKATRPRFAKRR